MLVGRLRIPSVHSLCRRNADGNDDFHQEVFPIIVKLEGKWGEAMVDDQNPDKHTEASHFIIALTYITTKSAESTKLVLQFSGQDSHTGSAQPK